MLLPRYPVYIPSRGRVDVCQTANFLVKDSVPFHLVVEPNEYKAYAKKYGKKGILVLPWNDLGMSGLIAVRNWIKEHATAKGHKRHWQLDDNIRAIFRRYRGLPMYCPAGVALAAAEDFVDRYENIAIAGFNYEMFSINNRTRTKVFNLNAHVYSCSLVLNDIPHRWRLAYNDDVDICLQVLADGWCTILFNVWLIDKTATMMVKGGNTPIYQGDGRLKMARSLERMWPGVVKTKRRFRRPQHVINWSRFDTPLKLKPGIDLSKMKPNEYGMKLVQVKKIKSKGLKKILGSVEDRSG